MERTDEEEEADGATGPDAASARVSMKSMTQKLKIKQVARAATISMNLLSDVFVMMCSLLWVVVVKQWARLVGLEILMQVIGIVKNLQQGKTDKDCQGDEEHVFICHFLPRSFCGRQAAFARSAVPLNQASPESRTTRICRPGIRAAISPVLIRRRMVLALHL